jgi:tetratricopeptide (TPR) repeat protein
MRRWFVPIFIVMAFAPCARGQFGGLFTSPPKTIPVQIEHGPSVGLTAKRVAFGKPSGPCAPELIDRMILPDFRAKNIEVIERENLDQILAEHNLSRGAEVSSQDEVAMGRILGPSVLIFVKVFECRGEKLALFDDQKNYNGGIVRTFISRVRYSVSGSVETVNLTTGQVLAAKDFKASKDQDNRSTSGQPEYPADDEIKDAALKEAGAQIHNVFFPWLESKELVMYDDKGCGMKDEYELYMRGDHDGAIKLALANLEQCKTAHKTDKDLARAYYNAGLASGLSKDYDKAKELLSQALQTKGAEAAGPTLAALEEERTGEKNVKEYQARFDLIPAPSPIVAGAPPPPPPPPAAGPATPPVVVPASGATVEERLKKLDQLLKQGLITKKEYDDKKAKILSEL